MLVLDLSSYDNDYGLYNFDNDGDGRAFFFLDDVDEPFPKPPDDDGGGGSLPASSTYTGIRILQISVDPGGGP